MKYSVVAYQMTLSNRDFRLDAEYYRPDYLELEKTLIRFNIENFGNLINEIRCGPFGSTLLCDTYLEDGVIVARPFNIKDCILENNNLVYISEKDVMEKKLKTFSSGDILFSRVGDVRCGIIPKFDNKITISPNIIGVKVNSKKINPYYATVFFNTKYGFPQIERGLKVVAQPTIQTDLIANLKIVIFSKFFQSLIEKLFLEISSANKKAKALYSQAEQIFLSELDLLNWKPKHRLSFVKNYSDTQSSSRIDAEYFQPMYEEIVKSITSTKEHSCLGDLVSIKKCIEPGSEAYQEKGILFLRVSNLSKFGIKEVNQQYLTEELYETLIQHQPKKGEILLSKDATPGIAYYLKDEPEKMIPSGGILRLMVNDECKLYPEYLTLVLNSVIVQKQIARDAGGSVINHWLVDQVKNTLIPVLPVMEQKKIAEMVNDSFCNRELSKHLLNIAKRGVEMAIEKDEKEAQNWITEKLKSFRINSMVN